MNLRFELRQWNGTSFGERHEIEYGETIAGFEAYVDQFATAEVEDEPARPWDGIVAGRQFTTADGLQFSAFAVRESTDD